MVIRTTWLWQILAWIGIVVNMFIPGINLASTILFIASMICLGISVGWAYVDFRHTTDIGKLAGKLKPKRKQLPKANPQFIAELEQELGMSQFSTRPQDVVKQGKSMYPELPPPYRWVFLENEQTYMPGHFEYNISIREKNKVIVRADTYWTDVHGRSPSEIRKGLKKRIEECHKDFLDIQQQNDTIEEFRI